MNANGLMMLAVLVFQAYAKDVMDTLVERAVDMGTNVRSDLESVTLGKGRGGGADVPAITPSRVSMLDASASQTDSQNPFGGADFQKMLEQYQKIQEKAQKAEGHLQKKVGELQNSLTWDLLRPVMKKSWQCSLDCADSDSATASKDFGSCLQKCNANVQQSQQDLQNYLQQIMQQDQQCAQGCQQQAPAKNETEVDMEKDQVDCQVKCSHEVEKHLPDYKAQIEKFMKQALDHPQEAHI